ncbi:biopolymer transport protein ExbD [Chromobacterium alkanivorans]|uniref:TonB system transport protein ExbD n=1 Tax=Chromobacterium alkanivorans TaxID=1071719 RepID=UPI0019687909|nr:TonB system transport protein ExbD [Chromobacterium alkanivorans]MBN3003609.1 TonB system transport protein ExbD [Chromobacterium alkanivorans]MCS3804373.1 biopolymer transport protein ExbD [Chromobacterium alkanivorans]MCS3818407.1 biopolymer transport protein ExbD [Chromobacterium alkanivorans]MCS3873657.1 biopolymer transport protein ExbD [Chromobacterium alkanivorans]
MAGGFPVRQDDELAELSDINVTPFIDVMLVLLIIFMVVAPLSTVDTRVELPASSARQQPRPDKPLYLTMSQDRSLLLGKQPVTLAELAGRLDRDSGGRRDTPLFFQADRQARYEDVMAVMDALREAGYLSVGLVAREGG